MTGRGNLPPAPSTGRDTGREGFLFLLFDFGTVRLLLCGSPSGAGTPRPAPEASHVPLGAVAEIAARRVRIRAVLGDAQDLDRC